MKKVFITGATGFIGNRLAHRLANDGIVVHALCYEPELTGLLAHPNIRIFEGNLLHPESLEEGIAGCEQVYHIAGYAKKWSRDPALFFRINTEGTVNVMNKARELGVRKVLATSTASVLGPSGEKPVDEEHIRHIDFFYEYESSKSLAEKKILQFVKEGLQAVIVNPTRVFGPGPVNESNATTKVILDYVKGNWRFLPGSGVRLGNYAFVEDVLEGMILAMEKGRPGEKYILGGANRSYREFFDTIAAVSRKHYKLWPVPVSLMMVLARSQYALASWIGKEPFAPSYIVKKYTYDWAFSSEKAQRELGYRITPFEEALERTIEWLFEQGISNKEQGIQKYS